VWALIVAQQLEARTVTGWSRLAAGGASVSLAVAAALQAMERDRPEGDGGYLGRSSSRATAGRLSGYVCRPPGGSGVSRTVESLAPVSTVMTYGIAMLGESTHPNWVKGNDTLIA
jgi:hypothetical protein